MYPRSLVGRCPFIFWTSDNFPDISKSLERAHGQLSIIWLRQNPDFIPRKWHFWLKIVNSGKPRFKPGCWHHQTIDHRSFRTLGTIRIGKFPSVQKIKGTHRTSGTHCILHHTRKDEQRYNNFWWRYAKLHICVVKLISSHMFRGNVIIINIPRRCVKIWLFYTSLTRILLFYTSLKDK